MDWWSSRVVAVLALVVLLLEAASSEQVLFAAGFVFVTGRTSLLYPDPGGRPRSAGAVGGVLWKPATLDLSRCPVQVSSPSPGTQSRSHCPDDLQRDCQPCKKEYYWLTRNGVPKCQPCTQRCSGVDELVEVVNCTLFTNRECQCRAGWFCETRAQYTCTRCQRHRQCEPGWGVLQPGNAFTDTTCQRCPAGHHSTQTSSTERCRAHTDCASLGQAVFLQGSDTRDEVCVHAASSTPSGGAATGQLSTSPTTHDSTAPPTTETTEPHPPVSLTNMITPILTLPITTSSTAPPSGPKGSLQSLAVFISISLICCLLLLLLKNRRRLGALLKHSRGMTDMKLIPQVSPSLRGERRGERLNLKASFILQAARPPALLEFQHKQQDCPLLAAEGERQESHEGEVRPPVEEMRPLGRAGDGAPAELGVSREPCSDSRVQQFIAEPKGGDSVNNNIGSIFILHPSTVILGSGRRGAERTGGGEEGPPISTPQQESQSPSHSQLEETCRASVCVQEEGGKDLHYPIPASGK
ncbi:tumor necrosis factor receptor superfamily member 8 [Polyodon spathula]|uniref:tumor necrosis factor receptor superfamily member 8 n=1 Tax=Polyodon spathula TaxID=7913 RepID=UPI001B7E3060|nr:tumor necrosis factor receptor superfamily member 8 [Polyodon spathula]